MTFERLELTRDFSCNPHIVDQTRLGYDIVDINRRWPTNELKMAATETGIEITIKRNELATRCSNGYPNICDNAGSVPSTPDIARLWLITGIHGGH